MEQELLPEHLRSIPVFSGVRVILFFCVVFCRSLCVPLTIVNDMYNVGIMVIVDDK